MRRPWRKRCTAHQRHQNSQCGQKTLPDEGSEAGVVDQSEGPKGELRTGLKQGDMIRSAFYKSTLAAVHGMSC